MFKKIEASAVKILLIFFVISFAQAYYQVSLFKTVFEKLHQEPPTPFVSVRNNIDVKYIEQKLDNFNENDNRTWRMRYLSNDYYFKEGGPIFIFVGGEWEISEDFISGGHMVDMARSLNAQMFYTEHRFYGRSHPFMTLELDNLKYLNVKQALADLAYFIKTVKITYSGLLNAKVVLFGASYSATMVTWFSRLYPDLLNGAWASSAPLHAQVEFPEFKEVVGQGIIEIGGQPCYNRIKNAIAILIDEIENHKLDALQKLINMCPGYDTHNEYDVMWLFNTISNYFSGIVQIHDEGDIQRVCSKIMSGPNDIEGVANFLKSFLSAENTCYRISYDDDLKEFKKTALKGIIRQWWYQTCNEIGWYHTSGSGNHPFGMKFPVDIHLKLCKDAYGTTFNEEIVQQNVEATNKLFGGYNPQVKNVFFTHGKLDPWHPVGILCDGECGAVIPRYSHCKDLASASSNDTQEMLEAKRTVFELVKKWIK